MKLGYVDRIEKRTIHILPRHIRQDLFDTTECTSDYIGRFYREIRGLGNIEIVKLQGHKYRTVGIR